MIKKTFKMIVAVDEKTIKDKYPNFNVNYSNMDEFAEGIAISIQSDFNCYKEFGYKIRVEGEVANDEN